MSSSEVVCTEFWSHCSLLPHFCAIKTISCGKSLVLLGAREFSLLHPTQSSDQLWAHPSSSSMGTSVLFEVKQPGHEVNHSLPSSAEVRNEWSCTSAVFLFLRSIQVQFDSQLV